jgi:hypothetical protein
MALPLNGVGDSETFQIGRTCGYTLLQKNGEILLVQNVDQT